MVVGRVVVSVVVVVSQVFDNGVNPKDEDEKRGGGKTREELGKPGR